MKLLRSVVFLTFCTILVVGVNARAFDDPRDVFVDDWDEYCDTSFTQPTGDPSFYWYGDCVSTAETSLDFCEAFFDLCDEYCWYDFCGPDDTFTPYCFGGGEFPWAYQDFCQCEPCK